MCIVSHGEVCVKHFLRFLLILLGYKALYENIVMCRRESRIYGMEKDNEAIPVPSKTPVIDPETGSGYLVSPVTVYPDIFKVQRDTRAVRTNTSIPSWLKDMAEAKGINYSQVLETALMEMMDLAPSGLSKVKL